MQSFINYQDLHDARNTWHKLDQGKPSQFRVDDDRLSITRLNKYDLENYECRSEYENSVISKRLELNAEDYKKEMSQFYATRRKLEIVLVPELSDLRTGGRITLKCTNEGDNSPKNLLSFFYDCNKK